MAWCWQCASVALSRVRYFNALLFLTRGLPPPIHTCYHYTVTLTMFLVHFVIVPPLTTPGYVFMTRNNNTVISLLFYSDGITTIPATPTKQWWTWSEFLQTVPPKLSLPIWYCWRIPTRCLSSWSPQKFHRRMAKTAIICTFRDGRHHSIQPWPTSNVI